MINKAREAREARAAEAQQNRLAITPAVANRVIGFASMHSAITSAPAPAHNKI